MKRAAMMAAAVAVAVALTGCEPAMTITAGYDRASGESVACGEGMEVIGRVTPATATKKVVLQMTKGGKWIDAKGWADADTVFLGDPSLRTGNVNQASGRYVIHYAVDWLSSTRHLRVRSAGGATSPGFYVKSEGIEGYCLTPERKEPPALDGPGAVRGSEVSYSQAIPSPSRSRAVE